MSVRVCTDTNEYFRELIASISEAKHRIEIEMYIFELDELGLEIMRALIQAVQRNVRVRVLLDGVGSFFWSQTDLDHYRKLGIDIKVYHPVSFKHIFHLNRRNHQKVVLVDEKVLFSGSINFSKKVLNWHETGVILQNAHLKWVSKSFEWLWNGSPLGRAPSPNTSEIRTTLTRRMRKKSHKIFREQIRHSVKQLCFVTPYLNLSLDFILLVFRAVRRNVDVKFLLPQESDVLISKYLNRAFYALLLSGGIRVFEYRPKVLHSKIALIDHLAWVGSSNLNQRSLIHDLELDFLLSDPRNVETLQSRLLYDLQNAIEITPERLREWGVFGRLLSKIVYWFRRYL